MTSQNRNKRRTKLVTPANSSFSNCVQDHLFIQPLRGPLENFRSVVYLDDQGRKHGRVSDHLLQRQIESDRQKLKKQSIPKVPMSSTLYGIRNPNIVALVKDVPVDDKDEDDDEPANDEVKFIEYKKPSKPAISDTNKRQTSSTSGKESVKFDRTLSVNMTRIVDSHLTGTDDIDTLDDDDEEDLESVKPMVCLRKETYSVFLIFLLKSNPDSNSRGQTAKSAHGLSEIPSTPKDNDDRMSTDLSRHERRQSQGMHMPPSVEDINDTEEGNKLSSPGVGQREKQSPTVSEKREERLKSASSRPKTGLSTRSRVESEEQKSSRASSASTSSDDTSALLRSENDESANLTDNDLNNEEEQIPIETPVKSDHSNSTMNDVVDIIEQEHITPEPIDKPRHRNAKGEYDANQVIQLKESFQPIINEAASYGHLDVVRQLLEVFHYSTYFFHYLIFL